MEGLDNKVKDMLERLLSLALSDSKGESLRHFDIEATCDDAAVLIAALYMMVKSK